MFNIWGGTRIKIYGTRCLTRIRQRGDFKYLVKILQKVCFIDLTKNSKTKYFNRCAHVKAIISICAKLYFIAAEWASTEALLNNRHFYWCIKGKKCLAKCFRGHNIFVGFDAQNSHCFSELPQRYHWTTPTGQRILFCYCRTRRTTRKKWSCHSNSCLSITLQWTLMLLWCLLCA